MQKIKTLFLRDPDNLRMVTRAYANDLNAVALTAPGVRATVKVDGTACLISHADGDRYRLWRRHTMRNASAPMPDGWQTSDGTAEPWGPQYGWVPVGTEPHDKWHREGFTNLKRAMPHPRATTYELVGPKVQTNPYRLESHHLMTHGAVTIEDAPTATYENLHAYLQSVAIEGIVWWNDAGPIAKITRRDMGLPWPCIGAALVPVRGA